VNDIPEAEAGASGPPGRGLCYLRPHELGLEALCDCGTTTVLTVAPEDISRLRPESETAFTCDGCESVHWLTFRQIEETL
jgi:hypothetical protein